MITLTKCLGKTQINCIKTITLFILKVKDTLQRFQAKTPLKIQT